MNWRKHKSGEEERREKDRRSMPVLSWTNAAGFEEWRETQHSDSEKHYKGRNEHHPWEPSADVGSTLAARLITQRLALFSNMFKKPFFFVVYACAILKHKVLHCSGGILQIDAWKYFQWCTVHKCNIFHVRPIPWVSECEAWDTVAWVLSSSRSRARLHWPSHPMSLRDHIDKSHQWLWGSLCDTYVTLMCLGDVRKAPSLGQTCMHSLAWDDVSPCGFAARCFST